MTAKEFWLIWVGERGPRPSPSTPRELACEFAEAYHVAATPLLGESQTLAKIERLCEESCGEDAITDEVEALMQIWQIVRRIPSAAQQPDNLCACCGGFPICRNVGSLPDLCEKCATRAESELSSRKGRNLTETPSDREVRDKAHSWLKENFPSVLKPHYQCRYDHIDIEQLCALLADYARWRELSTPRGAAASPLLMESLQLAKKTIDGWVEDSEGYVHVHKDVIRKAVNAAIVAEGAAASPQDAP